MTASSAEHRFYLATIIAKALLGLTQIVTAVALSFGAMTALPGIIQDLFRNELAQDPNDFIATAIIGALGHVSTQQASFYTLYFAAHGIVHITVVAALLSGARWAHTAAIMALGAFVVYQLAEWFAVGGPALLVLTAIDLIVIILTLRDQKAANAH